MNNISEYTLNIYILRRLFEEYEYKNKDCLHLTILFDLKGDRNEEEIKEKIKNKKFSELNNIIVKRISFLKEKYKISDSKIEELKNELKEKVNTGKIDGIISILDDNNLLNDIIKENNKGHTRLKTIPMLIFYKGNINLIDKQYKRISVIGLLNPTEKIEEDEKSVIENILKKDKDIVIISGLANGCDFIAHKKTLDMNCKTVAFLPSPVDDIIPKNNKNLADEIVKNGGLLVSEYFSSICNFSDKNNVFKLFNRYFERDRFQAFYSDIVILSASYSKKDTDEAKLKGEKKDSGAYICMNTAKEYGNKRAIIYNEDKNKNDDMYNLAKELKKDSDVIIIDNPNNVSQIFECMDFIKSNKIEKQGSLF